MIKKLYTLLFVCLAGCLVFISCNDKGGKNKKKGTVNTEKKTTRRLKQFLALALEHNGKVDDSIHLKLVELVSEFYNNHDEETMWSHDAKWVPLADSLIRFIGKSEAYGLFPDDYHFRKLRSLKNKLEKDSVKRKDAGLWAKADLMLTDGFLILLKDLKSGRLPTDSTFLKRTGDPAITNFYTAALESALSENRLAKFVDSVEPKQKGYQDLKKCIPRFLDSMDRKVYTYLTFPFKKDDEDDSLLFIKTIQKRLKESNCVTEDNELPDSLELSAAVKKYQKKKGIKVDGKISATLVRSMNLTDLERFKRIAITLDRYKQLPATMPEKYIWVNLPAYYLKVWDHDSLALESKIICGKPDTRTPLLYSVISDMVTYPTWTVPNSIIAKQYLPKLKINPNYLSRIGLRLVNSKGETVNAEEVKWSRYTKGIPYNVVQASGDGNALGIMKFNFSNPFSVYLHDTNQRYLFSNSSRALSHGCVRVEQWEALAFYISRNDSMNLKPGDVLSYNTDSIKSWLSGKVKKRIAVKNGIPLFITYFCCEGRGEKIRFYEDIYGEDKLMREKCFSDK